MNVISRRQNALSSYRIGSRTFPVGAIAIFGLLLSASSLSAQTVTPDSTVGTTVTTVPGGFNINGGTMQGNNLFHSFQDFSPATSAATFNVSSGSVERVISRVTGNTISNIDGVLSVLGGNSPDFFLLNPNGIVFGPNAALNVPGSFLASTAESLQFADGRTFSTTTASLLSVATPTGLGMGSNPGSSITNASTVTPGISILVLGTSPVGLSVGTSGAPETIALVGGEVNLTGGVLTAPGGRVEVGAVGANTTVGLTATTSGYELDYGNTTTFADINLTQGALINTSSTASGPIQLRGDRINITESARVLAATSGSTAATGGVSVTARQLDLSDRGIIVSSTSSTGASADIAVNVSESIHMTGVGYDQLLQNIINLGSIGTIDLNNLGAAIATLTTGSSGQAGNITVNTPVLDLASGAIVGSSTLASGSKGNLDLDIGQSTTINASAIFTGSSIVSTGNGGNIALQTPKLHIQDGGLLNTSTLGQGQGGSINIAAQTITLLETRTMLPSLGSFDFLNSNTRTTINSTNTGLGDAGNIHITTQTLSLQGGAAIATNSAGEIVSNAGRGGNLKINATDAIAIAGGLVDGSAFSELDTSTTSTSAAGNLQINTGNLTLDNGGRITASTSTSGASGTINITATGDVILRNQSVLTASALGTATGASGDITIAAGESLQLLDRAQLTANTNQGNGGNLRLSAGDIVLLRRGSLISTTAGGNGNGGNIAIAAPVIAGYENSDIVANAAAGNGGNITISTQGIFGLVFRDRLTPDNDITASSELGVSGNVELNEFSFDPSSGLVDITAVLTEPTEQVADTCATAGKSEFIVTGRGGVPPTPEAQGGGGDRPWQDLRDLTAFLEPTVAPPTTKNTELSPTPVATLREATGFQMLANGEVHLIAQTPGRATHERYATCAAPVGA